MAASFWTYKDAQGVDVVVQKFEEIPAQYRAKATTLDAAVTDTTQKTKDIVGHQAPRFDPAAAARGFTLHMPSALVGGGAGAVLAVLLMVMIRRRSRAMAIVLTVLMIAAIGAGYLTMLRQQAGLGGDGVATPAAILEDAKAASDALKRQMNKQDAALREVEGMK